MKKFLMNKHWDGLEGGERSGHEHKWRLSIPNEIDKRGRPYCTVCGGEVSFFELKEVPEEEVELYTQSGRYIMVERDSDFGPGMGCTVPYKPCSECSGILGRDTSCVCVVSEKIQEMFDNLGITDWWISDISYDYGDSDVVVVDTITYDSVPLAYIVEDQDEHKSR